MTTALQLVELRHLRYFIAVAEELHFGRAAERLHMSQPPLSQQIRQLEETLDVRLLDRNRRRVALTPAGEIFLAEARRVVGLAGHAIESVQEAARGERGRLQIGFVSSAPFNVLPRVLRVFRDQVPHVTLVLHEMGTAAQLEALSAGSLDAGFVRPPAAHDGITVEVVLREPLLVALPQDHVLAGRRLLRVEELAHEGFVLFPRESGPGLYDRIVGLCQRAGFLPRVTQEIGQMHAIVALVAAGLGVSLVPASLRPLRAQGLVYRALAGHPMVEMGLAYRERMTSPVLQRFVEVVRRQAQ